MIEPGADDAGTSPGNDADRAPRCYRHPDRETYVSCVRCGRPICPECMRPAAVGFQCPEEVKDARRVTRAPRTVLGGQVAHSGHDATTILIGLNVVVFVIMTASGTSFWGSHLSWLFELFAEIPGRVQVLHNGSIVTLQGVANGDWYRLVTSMFLHFGIVHIAANMYVLFLVGPALERAMGRLRFVALYLVAGFGGSVASFLFAGQSEIAAGASGAIFGLFGAYYVVARRFGGETGAIIGTIVINLIISVAIPNIDIHAHIGGLIVGAVLGAILAYAPRERRHLVHVGGFVVVTAILIGLAVIRGDQIRHDERAPRPAGVSAAATVSHLPSVAPASRPSAIAPTVR